MFNARNSIFETQFFKITYIVLTFILILAAYLTSASGQAKESLKTLGKLIEARGLSFSAASENAQIRKILRGKEDDAAEASANSGNSVAAPGDLDPTFGTGGKTVVGSLNGISVLPTSIALQSDGKILFAGNNNTGLTIELVVARLNANGTLDNSFGTNGVVSFGFGDLLSAASDIALQSDGKIVIAGVASANFGSDADFAIARLNSNGSLDNTFDADGRVTTSFEGNLTEAAFGIKIQPDGKIIAAGSRQDPITEESWFAVARYNSNGSLDSAFDGDGRFFAKPGINNELSNIASSIALQPDGKIIVAGETSSISDSQFALLRITSSGALDTSFSEDGKIQTRMAGLGAESANSVAIQNDGKILAAGNVDTDPNSGGGNDDFGVARYNPDGSLDMSFSADGKATLAFGAALTFEQARSVNIQSDGKILLGGFSGSVSLETGLPTTEFALIRLNSNGTADTSFGNGGFVKTPFSEQAAFGYTLQIQSDGNVLMGGLVGSGDPQLADSSPAISRYLNTIGTGPRAATLDFDGDGKSDISIFRPSVGEWYYLSSLTGNSPGAQFGASSDKIAPADFTGDGKADFAFFRPSDANWYIIRSENSTFFAFPYGANGDIPAPGDFDGDGKADATIFRPSSGLWASLRSSDSQSTILQFGANGDIPVVADYDGDGKADFSVYRPSAGEWYTRRSSTGAVFGAPFGAVGDKPVQGDYTGDGKADFAVFRPSSGFWYILRSEDQSFFGSPFGVSTDTPTIGDYDGDGKNDFAVFRPSTGNWFVQRSTAGFFAATFGVATDRPAPAYYLP